MALSAVQNVLEAEGTQLVLPLARAREAGESALMAFAAQSPGALARLGRGNTEISPLAMLLGRLANVAADEMHANTGLLTQPPFAARDMALGLQKSVSTSGLFYESHLARWIEGKHSLEALRLEPQTRSPRIDGNLHTSQMPTPESPVAEDLAPLVRRQLEFIENPTLYWRGDLWPGQSASLEIQADRRPAEDRTEDGTENQAAWITRLRLEMPNLGGIVANISFHANSAAFSIDARDGLTARTMAQARSDLEDALAAHGVRIENFSVTAHVGGK